MSCAAHQREKSPGGSDWYPSKESSVLAGDLSHPDFGEQGRSVNAVFSSIFCANIYAAPTGDTMMPAFLSVDCEILLEIRKIFFLNLILKPWIPVQHDTGDKSVTYNACVVQLFFVIFVGAAEFFLLTAMSYDRYVAICKPLRYTTIMNDRVCTICVLGCWLTGLLVILPPLSLGVQLDFCNSNLIDHFGCDASPLLKIVCSDTQFVEQVVLTMDVLTLIFTLVCVIVSYTYIIKTILGLPSARQRKKAFSTCSSHVIVVSLTYGSCIFIYIKPAKEGVALNKVVSLLNTSFIPLMNLFIYTLQNKQVKQAFKDSLKKIAFLSEH
ncbi:olfactory receptor 6C2-like [Loxodonta africana]|uniref:olfactory receptor 6C2-like n=1 Tax=Loxodonta africana TaxID=9785 RepID=UPI0030D4812C